jgi:hypothetical protein
VTVCPGFTRNFDVVADSRSAVAIFRRSAAVVPGVKTFGIRYSVPG